MAYPGYNTYRRSRLSASTYAIVDAPLKPSHVEALVGNKVILEFSLIPRCPDYNSDSHAGGYEICARASIVEFTDRCQPGSSFRPGKEQALSRLAELYPAEAISSLEEAGYSLSKPFCHSHYKSQLVEIESRLKDKPTRLDIEYHGCHPDAFPRPPGHLFAWSPAPTSSPHSDGEFTQSEC